MDVESTSKTMCAADFVQPDRCKGFRGKMIGMQVFG